MPDETYNKIVKNFETIIFNSISNYFIPEIIIKKIAIAITDWIIASKPEDKPINTISGDNDINQYNMGFNFGTGQVIRNIAWKILGIEEN